MMKPTRKIPREELSPKVLDFCGKNTIYKVEEKIVPPKKGERVLLFNDSIMYEKIWLVIRHFIYFLAVVVELPGTKRHFESYVMLS